MADDLASQATITVADRMVMIEGEAPRIVHCSPRLNFGKISKEFIKRDASTLNYQAMGGQKEINNMYLANLAQQIDGHIVVIDAGHASTTYAMLEIGIDGSDIIAVNFDCEEMKEMTKTLHESGNHDVHTYEGCFLEFMNCFDGQIGLAYDDFTWRCPKYNTTKYWEYVEAIGSSFCSGNIQKGAI